MKRNLLLLALLTLTASSYAEEQMVVGGRDGQVILTQDLKTLQKLTFTAQTMQIHTSNGEITEIALEGIGNIKFDDVEGISITRDDMSNLKGETRVYALDGHLVARAEGWTELLYQSLPAGTYAVRIGDRTIKIIK